MTAKRGPVLGTVLALGAACLLLLGLRAGSEAPSTAPSAILALAQEPVEAPESAGLPAETPEVGADRLRKALPLPAVKQQAPLIEQARDGESKRTTPAAVAHAVLPADTRALSLEIRRGDTLDRLFRRNRLAIADLHAITQLEGARESLKLVRPGDVIALQAVGDRVQRLTRRLDEATTLEVTRNGDGFEVDMLADELETRVEYAHGRIDSSLFLAGRDAGISDALIMQLAGIFAWDVDFVLDIREGDEFVLLYEQIWRDGEFLRDGAIVAAEFVNDGRAYRAVRFTDAGGRTDYYTPEGRSVRKAFLRAPLDFSRVSSNFNPRRRHPVLNTIRAHRGVDYAAPSGTQVRASGDGKVIFRGRKGGYGNCVILQHGGNISTLYAHLSRFSNKLRHGSRVKQGQTIGYVGSTGLASGPHLHYEYRVSGVHRNPRTVKLPQADPINSAYREAYRAHAERSLAQLELVRRTRLADID